MTEGRRKNTLLKHSISLATLPGPSTESNRTSWRSSNDEAKKAKDTRGKRKRMVVVPYVRGLSETFARILKSHCIATANRPHRTLQNFVVHRRTRSAMRRRPI